TSQMLTNIMRLRGLWRMRPQLYEIALCPEPGTDLNTDPYAIRVGLKAVSEKGGNGLITILPSPARSDKPDQFIKVLLQQESKSSGGANSVVTPQVLPNSLFQSQGGGG